MNLSAVILAGGKSSRMGRDKAFVEIGGQTLLARQIQTVREAGATEIFISGRAGVDYSTFGCRQLNDQFPDAGPLAGIQSGLMAATAPLLLVLAVDMPGMSAEFLQKLAEGCSQNAGAVPRVNGNIEPLAAIYPKAALPLATRLLQENSLSVKDFSTLCVQAALASFVELPGSCAGLFLNCNDPGELASVRRAQAG